jgi:hypothetical protein
MWQKINSPYNCDNRPPPSPFKFNVGQTVVVSSEGLLGKVLWRSRAWCSGPCCNQENCDCSYDKQLDAWVNSLHRWNNIYGIKVSGDCGDVCDECELERHVENFVLETH